MSHKLKDLQAETKKLAEEAGQRTKTGLQANVGKRELMKKPNQQQQQQQQAPITINEGNLKEVASFTHPGRQHYLNYRRRWHRRGNQRQDEKSKIGVH
ncbi:unnamed protein product [Heterobilharzia americana]|nr:unnamed protein product [Heterobilharzia americana]